MLHLIKLFTAEKKVFILFTPKQGSAKTVKDFNATDVSTVN